MEVEAVETVMEAAAVVDMEAVATDMEAVAVDVGAVDTEVAEDIDSPDVSIFYFWGILLFLGEFHLTGWPDIGFISVSA